MFREEAAAGWRSGVALADLRFWDVGPREETKLFGFRKEFSTDGLSSVSVFSAVPWTVRTRVPRAMRVSQVDGLCAGSVSRVLCRLNWGLRRRAGALSEALRGRPHRVSKFVVMSL